MYNTHHEKQRTRKAVGLLPHERPVVERSLRTQLTDSAARNGAQKPREAWGVGERICEGELAVGQ